ncbi:hypothetical protein M404DRAFT_309057 [Pisolithus tinctorius Marx 270]|uniref:Uncharacterized protein n=1 Tax=Pisolithus tinctorius Marx 270 TaxID=870435 RepID=A0A0C3P772_PISTI|nr:hypothetical protein M404DRAFT_309057 [Pisolithus tinctorius Marx 270]
MPWSLGIPPQKKGRMHSNGMLNVSNSVKSLLTDIERGRSSNHWHCLESGKFSSMHRLSNQEDQNTSQLLLPFMLTCSMKLIDQLTEQPGMESNSQARCYLKRSWEGSNSETEKGDQKRMRLIDQIGSLNTHL